MGISDTQGLPCTLAPYHLLTTLLATCRSPAVRATDLTNGTNVKQSHDCNFQHSLAVTRSATKQTCRHIKLALPNRPRDCPNAAIPVGKAAQVHHVPATDKSAVACLQLHSITAVPRAEPYDCVLSDSTASPNPALQPAVCCLACALLLWHCHVWQGRSVCMHQTKKQEPLGSSTDAMASCYGVVQVSPANLS